MAKTKTKTKKEIVAEPEVKVKKKKHHVGIIILCTFLTIFIVLPVGFFFGFIFDTSSKKVTATGDFDASKVMRQIMNDALQDAKTTKKITMSLGEAQIDEVLMAAAKKINMPDYLPQMYCTIKDNHYNIYADLQAGFIKTRVAICTTIDKEVSNDTDSFVFKVDSINLGRCGFLTDLIFNVGSNFIDDQTLGNILANTGFHLDFDLAHHQIRYKKVNFCQDLDNILIKALGENNMFNSLISYAVEDEELFNLDFSNAITANFNLEKLNKTDAPKAIDIKYDSHLPIIQALYDNGTITNNQQAQSVWNFLVKGYENLNDTDAAFIENNRVAIEVETQTPIDEYRGDDAFDSEKSTVISDLTKEFSEQIETAIEEERPVEIKKEILNDFAKTLGIVGHASFIDNVNDEGKHNVNYFCIDGFDFDFRDPTTTPGEEDDGGVDITVNLNVNGCPTTFTIPTILNSDTTQNVASFRFDDIYVGNIKIEEENVIKNLGDIIKSNIASLVPNDDAFTIDKDNNFTFNFDKLLQEAGKKIEKNGISTSKSNGLNIKIVDR